MLRRVVCLMLVFIIFIINIPSLDAATSFSNVTIKLNGIILDLDAKPRVLNGRILVPVASLVKELGATVEWIAITNSVIITKPTRDTINTIYLKIGQASALINGVDVKLDAAATVYDNRAFVPIRFIAENFGATVKWFGKTKTVSITYDIPALDEPPKLIPPWELKQKTTTGAAISVTK